MKTKYHRWYGQLVQRAKSREIIDGYCERHHIKPRCLGGDDRSSNIVQLTYREHFLAHWLLTKMHSGMTKRKMQYALMQMARRGRGKQRIFTSWQYDTARAVKEGMAGRKVSTVTRKKIADSRRGAKLSPAAILNLAKRMKGNTYRRGKPLSRKTRRKMSIARIGNTNTLGFKASKETRKKISKSLMGNKHSVGRILPPEHVAAIRAGHKRYWEKRWASQS